MGGVVERARADIAAGRLWKARDRLASVLAWSTDAGVLDLAGQVYMAMGDAPRAGAAWALVRDDDDPEFRAAYEALRERCGRSPIEILNSLPLHGRPGDYPEHVTARVALLVESAREKGRLPRNVRRYLDVQTPLGAPSVPTSRRASMPRRFLHKLGIVAIWLVIALLVGALVIGLGTEAALAGTVFKSAGVDPGPILGAAGLTLIALLAVRTILRREGGRRAQDHEPAPSLDERARRAPNADVALGWGLLSIALPIVGWVGIWYGRSALRAIQRSGGRLGGERMARAGLILGTIGTIEMVLIFIFLATYSPS